MENKQEQENALKQAVEKFRQQGGTIKKASGEKKSKSKSPQKKKQGTAKKAGNGRRPVLTSWAMLRIKVGTQLACTLSKDVTLTTRSDVTMECELYFKGKSKGRFLGLMKAERAVRDMLKKPVKSPQGWGVFTLSDSPKKGEQENVHKRYLRLVQPS